MSATTSPKELRTTEEGTEQWIDVCPRRSGITCGCDDERKKATHAYTPRQLTKKNKKGEMVEGPICGRFPGMSLCGCTVPCRTARQSSSASMILASPRLLFVSAAPVAFLLCDELHAAGVGQVVNLCGISYPQDPRFRYLNLPIDDSSLADISSVARRACAFIAAGHSSSPSRGALVHCEAGVSRSTSVCIAYVISALGLSFEESLAFVSRMHPRADPNPGFRAQLKAF